MRSKVSKYLASSFWWYQNSSYFVFVGIKILPTLEINLDQPEGIKILTILVLRYDRIDVPKV